ncbi:MAG: pectate lyase [Bacteroidia bacterium]
MKRNTLVLVVCLLLSALASLAQSSEPGYLDKKWKQVATQMPETWYGSGEAKIVAENVLLSQKEIGGWEKNKAYHRPFSASEKAHYTQDKAEIGATFDNDATITELRFLAKMYAQIKDERYKEAFERGLEYIFVSQYDNGGWPQFYPLREGYYSHITFNDDAMVNIMEFLDEIASEKELFAALKLDQLTKTKVRKSFEQGIDCILKTQIKVNDKLTVWCAQHDVKTLAPAQARSYELASFSGAESVDIVLLLMKVANPSPEIIAAINGAVKWFEAHKIEGIKLEQEIDQNGKKNRIVVEDQAAPPLWGRFYDLESSKPYFCSRDGIKKSTLAEISHERRNGYSWYTNAPAKVLQQYPEWQRDWDRTDQLDPVSSGVYKWADHPVKTGALRESRKILEGTSAHFTYLEIHATTQFPGAKPSTAHANTAFEECIIVKEGMMQVTIEGESAILGPGGVILLMPQQMHSLANVGETNLTYYVMKYQSKLKMDIRRGQTAGGSLMLNADSLRFNPSTRGGGRPYFDRSTAMCERFEMHLTQLNNQGPSHKPHAHEEAEIILVISGSTEMTIDGQEYSASAGDFYFMDTQLSHGVRNATNEACSYFAFKWR